MLPPPATSKLSHTPILLLPSSPDPRREMTFIRLQVSPVIMTVESKMASPDLLSYGFSVIVALGGVIGYMKAGRYEGSDSLHPGQCF